MLLQRLATGATGVKQARYRQGPTLAARHSYAHALFTMHGLHMNSAEGFALYCGDAHPLSLGEERVW